MFVSNVSRWGCRLFVVVMKIESEQRRGGGGAYMRPQGACEASKGVKPDIIHVLLTTVMEDTQ